MKDLTIEVTVSSSDLHDAVCIEAQTNGGASLAKYVPKSYFKSHYEHAVDGVLSELKREMMRREK